jgi:hypothetical protein
MASPFVVRQYVPRPRTPRPACGKSDRGEGRASSASQCSPFLASGSLSSAWPRTTVLALAACRGGLPHPARRPCAPANPGRRRGHPGPAQGPVASRKRTGRIRPALYRPRPGRAYTGRDGRSRPCHAGPSDHILRAGPARRASGASPRLDPLSLCRAARQWTVRKSRPRPGDGVRHCATAWPTVPPPELCFFSFWPFLSESSKAAAPRSTSLAPRSKAPPPNHRPHQLGREHVDRRSRAPVKRRYAQPADDSAPPRFPWIVFRPWARPERSSRRPCRPIRIWYAECPPIGPLYYALLRQLCATAIPTIRA